MTARSRARIRRYFVPALLVLMITVLRMTAQPDHTAGQTVRDPGAVIVMTNLTVAQSIFVPDAEQALLDLMNQTRRQHGLGVLVMNSVLRTIARRHSREVALGGFIGHGSPSSESFLDRLSTILHPGAFVGENVTCALTITQVEAAFEASRGHLPNILEPRFRTVGIGIATGALGLLVTEDFTE
jgi:uncharacterized protein YkwD